MVREAPLHEIHLENMLKLARMGAVILPPVPGFYQLPKTVDDVVKRLGLAKTWLCGMLLSIAVFVWATQLSAGQTGAFIAICALSGVALGTDLALPGAMLAGVIQRNGDSGKLEGAYFGWWNFAIKLNLALAAGLALPLLSYFGYSPGARDAQALSALVIAYCVLPCLLKLLAAGSLYFLVIKQPEHFKAIHEQSDPI